MNKKISIFAYGSLLNRDSLRKTTPSFSHYFTAVLPGYRRAFNFKSPYRTDAITGKSSSVLNLVELEGSFTNGMCFIADERSLDELYRREAGYEFELVRVYDERDAPHDVHTFIARENKHYPFTQKSNEQDEYLSMCLSGARRFGKQFYEQFLDNTYVDDTSLRSYLAK